MTIQIKVIEQYFHVVLFIILYRVVLALKSGDEMLMRHYALSFGTVYYGGSNYNFESVDVAQVCDCSIKAHEQGYLLGLLLSGSTIS